MKSIQDARGILADAEKSLRDLMPRDIREQRYREIPEIARLADGVARLLRGEADDTRHASQPVQTAPRKPTTGTTMHRNLTARNSSRSSKDSDPRFARDGTKLVKIGWSKKGREEYEHRAPREVVAAFASHLMSHVSVGGIFVIEGLLPVPDTGGGEVPSYQVCLTLAWLREAGAVEKKAAMDTKCATVR